MPLNDEGLASDLALSVIRLARQLRGRRVGAPVSLTQLSALSALQHEGPMTPGALAARERVQPPSMTRVIASLVDLDMVRREPHPTDGRQVVVTLSPKGDEVITAEAAARREWLKQQMAHLNADDVATLRAAIELMNGIVGAHDPAVTPA